LSQNAVSELAGMRESRTRRMPPPMRDRKREGLTCSIFRSARRDHPSVTLALMPRAPNRKRTARSDRSSRCAILLTGWYPANSTSLASSASVHGLDDRLRAEVSSDVAGLAVPPCGTGTTWDVFRRCRMRCQQSPRFHCGTSSRIRLIASRFLTGPCLIPAISSWSIAASRLLSLLVFAP